MILTDGSTVTSNLGQDNGVGVYIPAPIDTEREEPSLLTVHGGALITLNTAGNDGGGAYNDRGVFTVVDLAAVVDNTPSHVLSLP